MECAIQYLRETPWKDQKNLNKITFFFHLSNPLL